MSQRTVRARAKRMCARFRHLNEDIYSRAHPASRVWTPTGEIPSYWCHRCHDLVPRVLVFRPEGRASSEETT